MIQLLSLLMLFALEAEITTENTIDQDTADRPVAMVFRFRPDVMMKGAHDADWRQVATGQELFPSDTLITGDEGFAIIRFMDLSEMRIRPNTVLVVNGEVRGKDDTQSISTLERGEILFNAITGGGSEHEVNTGNAVAAVKGTSFTYKYDDLGSQVNGLTGMVEVTELTSGRTYELTGGSRMLINRAGEVIEDNIAEDDVDLILSDYDELVELAVPEVVRIQIINERGQTETIQIPFYKKNNQ